MGEVGSSGRAVERWIVNRGNGGSIPPTAVSKLAISFTPHLPVSFGRDTKSRRSLLSGVYARGSKRSHTGVKCVICSRLPNSRWTLNAWKATRPLSGRKKEYNGARWSKMEYNGARLSIMEYVVLCWSTTEQDGSTMEHDRIR